MISQLRPAPHMPKGPGIGPCVAHRLQASWAVGSGRGPRGICVGLCHFRHKKKAPETRRRDSCACRRRRTPKSRCHSLLQLIDDMSEAIDYHQKLIDAVMEASGRLRCGWMWTSKSSCAFGVHQCLYTIKTHLGLFTGQHGVPGNTGWTKAAVSCST